MKLDGMEGVRQRFNTVTIKETKNDRNLKRKKKEEKKKRRNGKRRNKDKEDKER